MCLGPGGIGRRQRSHGRESVFKTAVPSPVRPQRGQIPQPRAAKMPPPCERKSHEAGPQDDVTDAHLPLESKVIGRFRQDALSSKRVSA